MSTTVEIPGGTAELYEYGELTPRRQRPVKELGLRLGDLINRLQNAYSITSADGEEAGAPLPGLTGEPVEISEEQAALLTLFSDRVTIMWLKSWTLDIPLPTNTDELLDIPTPVYDELSKACAKAQASTRESEFEPSKETLADETSPTGASGG